MKVDRRKIEDGTDDDRDVDVVVTDLVDRRAERIVAARAGSSDRIDRPLRLEQLGDRACVVGVEAVEREEVVDEIGLLLERDPSLVLIVHVDVVTGDDGGHLRLVRRIDEQSRIQKAAGREEQ